MKLKALVLVILVSLLLAACAEPYNANPEDTAAPTETVFRQAQDGKPFYFVHSNRQHPVVRIMMAGFFQACADYGLDCKDAGVDGDDTAGVIRKMEEATALGSSGVLHTIYDPAFFQSALDGINAGIPVVNGHFPYPEGEIPGMLAYAAPDNKDYSMRAAKAIAEKIDCKGPVGVSQGGLNDGENTVYETFKATLEETCPGIVVVGPAIEGYDKVAAIAAVTAFLQGNPELTAGFSTTGGGAAAWAGALDDLGRKPGEVVVGGMDYSRENLDLVKNGKVYLLVGQPLFEEMYYGVQLLVTHMMGYPVPYANTLPAPLITKDNVDGFYQYLDKAESIEIK